MSAQTDTPVTGSMLAWTGTVIAKIIDQRSRELLDMAIAILEEGDNA